LKKLTVFALLVLLALPSAAQDPDSEEHRKMKAEADGVFRSYILSLHLQKLEEAYNLHSVAFKAKNPYADWSALEQEFYTFARGSVRYSDVLTTWHETAGDSERPGTYVNVQYSCEADTFSECSGLMILRSTDKKGFYIESHTRKYKLISVAPSI
jgi:hypothetical protein